MNKIIVLLMLVSLLVSCGEKKKFNLEIDYPHECKKEECEIEVIIEKDGKTLHSSKSVQPDLSNIKFPSKQNIQSALIKINIFINNELRFCTEGIIGQSKLLIPLPINGSRIVAKLNRPRFAHSQIYHPTGRVIISGGYSVKNSFETSIEIYDKYSNTLKKGKYTLKFPKAFHKSFLLEDGRVLITSGSIESYPEILDVQNESIETLKLRSKNLNYLGEGFIYYETSKANIKYGIIENIDTLKIIEEFKLEEETFNNASIYLSKKILLLGSLKPFCIDIESENKVKLGVKAGTSLSEGNLDYVKQDENIYFINRDNNSGLNFIDFSNNQIANIPDPALENTFGASLLSGHRFLGLVGNNFQIIDPMNLSLASFKLQKAREYHSVTHIGNGSYLISGGIDAYNESKLILNAVEIFQVGSGSEL